MRPFSKLYKLEKRKTTTKHANFYTHVLQFFYWFTSLSSSGKPVVPHVNFHGLGCFVSPIFRRRTISAGADLSWLTFFDLEGDLADHWEKSGNFPGISGTSLTKKWDLNINNKWF
jgi:hypothetical protein